MQIDGLSNSAAVTYDDNTNIGYGYSASSKTWTQIPLTGNLSLPPRIVEYIGIVPVDSRKGYYVYSAQHNYWGYLYSNDYKSEFVGENIACVRNHANKTLYAFYPDAVIEVNEDITNFEPESFKLKQNFPNPFNPITKIKFIIPSITPSGVEETFVTLKVYDVLGNQIATLISEEKPAGEYEIEFNGNGMSSGIYFYQLKSGSFIQTNKMILIK
jgi:hypothetical protein